MPKRKRSLSKPAGGGQRLGTRTETSAPNTPDIILIKKPRISPAVGVKPINVFQCSDEDLSVMVIAPGESTCFFGAAAVQCLAGEVCIDGYEMRETSFDRSNMHLVCAPYRMRKPIIFKAIVINDVLSISYKHNRLKYRLKSITPHYESVMNLIGDSFSAVLVIDRRPPLVVDVIQQLVEDFLIPREKRSKCHFDRTWFFPHGQWELYTQSSHSDLDSMIKRLESKRKEGHRCTVLPCAGKGAGKSTFLRYFVNRNISPDLPPVYVMDVDIGQSEFTPSGCMSLWKVTEPLLAVPWAHQKRTFTNAFFYGANCVGDDCAKYKRIFDQLLAEFNAKSEPGSLLIINTMGWVEGTGADILNYICSEARPAYAIQLPGQRSFLVPTIVPKTVSICPKYAPGTFCPGQLSQASASQKRDISPKQLRELTMIAYFACDLPRSVMSSFNEIAPYALSLRDCVFATPEDYTYVKDECFFGTINAQLVALCINETSELETRRLLGKEFLPRVVSVGVNTPPLKCIGYGFIRAVDLDRDSIFLCTPIPPEGLTRVTVMARGTDINMPHPCIASQNASLVPYLSLPIASARGSFHKDLYESLKPNTMHARGHYPQK